MFERGEGQVGGPNKVDGDRAREASRWPAPSPRSPVFRGEEGFQQSDLHGFPDWDSWELPGNEQHDQVSGVLYEGGPSLSGAWDRCEEDYGEAGSSSTESCEDVFGKKASDGDQRALPWLLIDELKEGNELSCLPGNYDYSCSRRNVAPVPGWLRSVHRGVLRDRFLAELQLAQGESFQEEAALDLWEREYGEVVSNPVVEHSSPYVPRTLRELLRPVGGTSLRFSCTGRVQRTEVYNLVKPICTRESYVYSSEGWSEDEID